MHFPIWDFSESGTFCKKCLKFREAPDRDVWMWLQLAEDKNSFISICGCSPPRSALSAIFDLRMIRTHLRQKDFRLLRFRQSGDSAISFPLLFQCLSGVRF